jgi:hypothetical protein
MTLLECVANRIPYLETIDFEGEYLIFIQDAIKNIDVTKLIDQYLSGYSDVFKNFTKRCLSTLNERPKFLSMVNSIKDFKIIPLNEDPFYEVHKDLANNDFSSACWKYYWVGKGFRFF